MRRSYLALAVVAAVLLSAVVAYSYAESTVVPASVQSWGWRRPVTVDVYADMYGAEMLIGVKPLFRAEIPWYDFMSPDFSDVVFVSGTYMHGVVWESIQSGTKAVASIELPTGATGSYTLYMYYNNPSATRFGINMPAVGFVWRSKGGIDPDIIGMNGAKAVGTYGGVTLVALWVYLPSTTVRIYIARYAEVPDEVISLYKAKLDIFHVDAAKLDFYDWVKASYLVVNASSAGKQYIDLNVPREGWYTIALRMSVTGGFNYITIYKVVDLYSGYTFGNAIDLVPIDSTGLRFFQVPVIWDSRYYSYKIGGAEPVSYVAPVRPTVVWNETVGNVYYEYLVYPRTVTVTVPIFTTVVRNVTVTLPPDTTLTTTVYIPVTTVTTYVPVEPTTITKTVTVTEPRFTATTYTTTVTKTVTKPVTETRTETTAAPVTTTTTVNGTPTTTTTYITTTTVVTTTYYTTVVETSPWRVTKIVPTKTETKTITTTVPVTTTIYAEVTMPVYYTATLTLVNRDATSTVTTTVPVTAAVDVATGEYAVMQPLVLGPYGGATTAYWVVRSIVTETVTETATALPVPVEHGLAILVAMLGIIGAAMYLLVRRARR